ncbi:hypothetical protein L1987_37803 [Smallanthus sonchifolius]|uniref:Uncharacterized protein n=1 Tax=Smallanthus sonchifolius TaxID=185202 RepID=A0ACB9HJ65_9ASTR|nr:hypothetical protein L1987_37803 [Smallanthus sonchifolius]
MIGGEDDDEYWVAAIAEMEAAATKLSSTFLNSNSQTKIESNKPTFSRQSTLDGFFGCKGINQEAKYDERISSVSIDPEAAKFWIYPEYPPVRDYQVSITETALFQNTLVSLPTGLGKTLIAAVVMYNYYKWFPKGKIVFAAPSRPLVMQQIEACHNIVGISQEHTIELTGQTTPSKRASLWKDKQIFFVTPQVLEKDIQSGNFLWRMYNTGSCPVKQLVCLVFDEAHRASGNYSYCVVVRELMDVPDPVHLRILALTATPGYNHQTVQQVIDNLKISSIEYRSENDSDVIHYLHDRKLDVIQVEMGKDAVEVNKLLMDVIRVHVKKLHDIGLLPKRDPQTFSPIDFINSRDRFRQFPPQDLAQIKYADVEGSFGVLITLYHIRKLVSAHGIRPAFELLEEKLKQGNFARLFSRNETIHKAKVIMQHNLSHGAHSPKFSKMLEVLVEHFKKHDPQKSRVIIFSHFRESVRDIMSSLATIGEYVKATEFVGQNSAKTSKGQSQKVQQAVLQKFRAGGYNVIVATSIGEEGLDIMEVDLVICFDANISPLRMIQRMGRTGRKSKGRVDILLFHLHVPHVFKPEKKLVKFSIEEFVPRGKKVKEDDAIQIPKYKLKLTDVETDLLEKYFDPARQDDERPSLIAFPHFQAFPSRVHEIAHSMRTTMLIDTMQYLQGLSFNGLGEETSKESFKAETVDHNSNTREDDMARKEPETDTLSLMDISKTKEQHHSFLFGSDFTTVGSNGSILVLSVPHFPLKPTKSSIPENTMFLHCLKSDNSKASSEEHPVIALDVNEDDLVVTSFNDLQEDKLDGDARVNSVILKGENNGTVIPNVAVDDSHSVEAGDFSPRLTNLLMSGVVPESPIHIGTSNTAKGYYTALDVDKTSISLVQSKNDEAVKESTPNKEIIIPHINIPNSFIEKSGFGSKFAGEIQTPLTNLSNKSCSKDWFLSSGEKTVSQPKKKLKRLRKFCDIKSGKEEIVGRSSISGIRSCAPLDHAFDKHGRDGRKLASSEASDDEEVENGEDYYCGSFIDDRINPTMAITKAETVQFDMMAVYRRSLLTQSPIVDSSPDNMVSVDDGSAAGTSVHTNGDSSSSAHLNTKRLSSDTVVIPSTTNGPDNETKRRKLSFSQGGCGPLPIRNLEKEVFLNSEATGKEVTWQMDEFDNDDDFLQGIDLDALEEQASKQLRSKSNMLNEKPKIQELDFLDSPSFDLGI